MLVRTCTAVMPTECKVNKLPLSHNDPQFPLLPSVGSFNAELRSIILDFLRRMDFKNSPEACSPDSRHQVEAALTTLCKPNNVPAVVIKYCGTFPALIFKLHSLEAQVQIAHFTALTIALEDLIEKLTGTARDVYLQDFALFQTKMCDPEGYEALYPGRGDLHPLLEDFMYHLRKESPFLEQPRMQTMLVKSAFDFLEGNLLEHHYHRHPMDFTPEMHLFSHFLRVKSGVSEPYAILTVMQTSGDTEVFDDHFYYNSIHPLVPELTEFFHLGNDVLSFYKEVEDGETDVAILINAQVKKQSRLDALKDAVDFLVEQRTRIIAIAEKSGSLELQKRIQQVYQGYISWHLSTSRYRFKQLLGDWYQGEYWC